LLIGWAVLLAAHASAANATTAKMKGQPWYGYTPIPAAMQPTNPVPPSQPTQPSKPAQPQQPDVNQPPVQQPNSNNGAPNDPNDVNPTGPAHDQWAHDQCVFTSPDPADC
jgi:type IV secretory pathway VirB10-like protein